MSSSSKASKAQILVEVLRLLDITRDLDRHKEDAEFSKIGGHIHYVFDENILEMFVHPQRIANTTATFYSSFWLHSLDSKDRRRRFSIITQSALIAAEYMLGGGLPGQRGGRLLMTDWHLTEFYIRVDELIKRQRELIDHVFPDKEKPDPTKVVNFDPTIGAQPFLEEDLRLVQADTYWKNEAIDRFITARTAANKVASDVVLQPMLQLKRLGETTFRHRIFDVEEQFTIPDIEFDTIEVAARVWKNRLLEEQKKWGHRTRSRTPGATSNDARSLALIQSIARRLDRNSERIVLVTSDRLLFDAYRRWHAGIAPSATEYFEPFVLRRPLQYAPIFNLADGVGDIEDRDNDLFNLTRAFMEVILLPFNLSRMESYGPDRVEAINRSREYFALKLVDFSPADLIVEPDISFFSNSLTEQWLADSERRMHDLRVRWYQAEQVAIGSMYGTIRARLSSELEIEADRFAEPGADDLGPLLTNYLSNLLDSVVEQSIGWSFPLARRFINTRIKKAFKSQPRPPILVRLKIPLEGGSTDLRNFLYYWVMGAHKEFSVEDEPKLTDRPDLVFATAATLALVLGAWSDANRFSELAERAGRSRSSNPDEHHEFMYLRAVSQRFRMAHLSPPRSEGGIAAVKRARDQAIAMLKDCLAYHSEPAHDQPLRKLRTLSERVALNIYYSMALLLSVGHVPIAGPTIRGIHLDEVLREVEEGLNACLELEAEILDMNVINDTERRTHRELLKRQISINIIAYVVIHSTMLHEKSENASSFLRPAITDRISELLTIEYSSLPQVVRAEGGVFLHLAKGTMLPQMDQFVQSRAARAEALSLDSARLDALYQWAKGRVSHSV